MGRPKLNREAARDPAPKLEVPAMAVKPTVVGDAKPCPKCDGKSTGPYKDSHGNFRCNCAESKCGFWDSQVYHTPEQALHGWNAAGGPARRDGW